MEEKIKQQLKQVAKTWTLKIVFIILIIALPIIFLAGFSYIITKDDSSYKKGDKSNPPYVASKYTEGVSIDSNGNITSLSTAQELWDELIENGSRINLYLDNAEELLKLMNAEIVTKFIDTRSNPDEEIDWEAMNKDAKSNKIQGIIKLKRADENGNVYTMTYADSQTFQSYIDEYNKSGSESARKNALSHFTLNETTTSTQNTSTEDSNEINEVNEVSESADTTVTSSQYYATVATWSETSETITTNDPGQEEKNNETTYTMTTTNINYQDCVRGYTMPFQYLWDLLIVGEDKDFVLGLADLVYGSEIEITVHDNLTETTFENVYTYTKKNKLKISYNYSIKTKDNNTVTGSDSLEKIESNDYKTTFKTVTRVNTLDISLTKADVWMAKYTKDYHATPDNSHYENTNKLDDVDYPASPNGTCSTATAIKYATEDLQPKINGNANYESGQVTSASGESYIAEIDKQENMKTTIKGIKYVADPEKTEEKTDKNSTEENFVTLFLKNGKARSNILDVSEWLFEILSENEDTVPLVDLTKYLLYKATGIDFGVTEFDMDIFNTADFINVNIGDTSELLKKYIHYWENSGGAPTNADGTCYIIESDGAGHPTVGYGVDIFNGGFEQEFIAAGYPTNIGGEVPIEFVDALEDREIEESVQFIRNKTSSLNLTEYQIYALVSRSYNCGQGGAVLTKRGNPSMDFVDSYNAYWKEEDDQFEEKNSNANFKHALYTNYMSTPVTSDGKYMSGLERRRKSEWTLFQTGYFDVLDTWYSSGGGAMGGITTEEERAQFQEYIETELIHTKYHVKNSQYQNGPFAKWWGSSYNYLSRFQCTWWANGRASMYLEQYGTKYKKYPTQKGNGGQYYDINAQNGWFNYGKTPKPNSLVCWSHGSSYGHVAYVEGVTSDGIYISHAGSGKSWFGVQKIGLDGHVWNGYTLVGYIYLDEPK